MDREDFFHVIAAAADATKEDEFVVIGSQALVGYYADPPAELLQSMEIDLYPKNNPERGIEIDGAIGEGSAFQAQYGYYAHSVGPETATAPSGWEERLVPVVIPPRIPGRPTATAWCMEAHDLVLAKLARGEERDWDFARAALQVGIVGEETLRALLPLMPVSGDDQTRIREAVAGIATRAQRD